MSKKLLIIFALLALLAACRKTDKYAVEVNSQPFLITGEMGLYTIGLGDYPGFLTSYLVGDTCTMIGRLFVGRPGSRIEIGNYVPPILYHRYISYGINEYTHQPDSIDYLKFLITDSMGIGDHIPVTITANGVTMQGPAISIRQFKGIKRATDTTLWVDNVTSWKPADMAYYQQNYGYLISQASVSGDGTIWYNNLTGIYAAQNTGVTQWMKLGDRFADANGAFFIRVILGSTVTFGGDSLVFSAETPEDDADTLDNYIYRVCKMDLATKAVTTLNRTLVHKGVAANNSFVGPYQGGFNTLQAVAINLKTDAGGNLYFCNNFPPPSTNFDATQQWYQGGTGPAYFEGTPQLLSNYCRVDPSGMLKSLIAENGPWGSPIYSVPGYPAAESSDLLVSPDGSTGYVADQMDFLGRVSLTYMDLKQDLPLVTTGVNPPPYRFYSYDTSLATGLQQTTWPFSFFFNYFSIGQSLLNDYLILSDGDLLLAGTASLAALDVQNGTMYCYAGTEKGIGAPPAVQNQTTGRAKYVSFEEISFAGTDKEGAIYYFIGNQDFNNGIQFYKLYSKP